MFLRTETYSFVNKVYSPYMANAITMVRIMKQERQKLYIMDSARSKNGRRVAGGGSVLISGLCFECSLSVGI